METMADILEKLTIAENLINAIEKRLVFRTENYGEMSDGSIVIYDMDEKPLIEAEQNAWDEWKEYIKKK